MRDLEDHNFTTPKEKAEPSMDYQLVLKTLGEWSCGLGTVLWNQKSTTTILVLSPGEKRNCTIDG